MNDQLAKEIRTFEEDHVWVSEHLEILLGQHAEQWIAVRGGEVIASDPDLKSLRGKLADPAHTCVEFVTREPLEMVL